MVEDWWIEYNTIRVHRALGYLIQTSSPRLVTHYPAYSLLMDHQPGSGP